MKTFLTQGNRDICADDLTKLMCFLMDVELTRSAASRKCLNSNHLSLLGLVSVDLSMSSKRI